METARNLPRILIIDESRMVRAMLIKHIRDFYDFREEADGEAGWQVLVLDHSIELVICSLSARCSMATACSCVCVLRACRAWPGCRC